MPESDLCCPGCGAPAARDAVSCGYCGRPLETTTCPACYAAMFVGSRYCPQCGAEAKRDEDANASPLPCPRCKQESMKSLHLGTTAVRECEACGGLWLDPASLQRLVDERKEHANVIHALNAVVPTAQVALDVVRYLPCPICKKLMNRMNFAHSSGIIVDMCKEDGVWLDRGELRRVMEFVSAGGMEDSRQREAEQNARVAVTAWFARLSEPH